MPLIAFVTSDIVDWLNENSGAVVAVSTFCYAVLTGAVFVTMLWANRQTGRAFKMQAKPRLNVRLAKDAGLTTLTVANIHTQPAFSLIVEATACPELVVAYLGPLTNYKHVLGNSVHPPLLITIRFSDELGNAYVERVQCQTIEGS